MTQLALKGFNMAEALYINAAKHPQKIAIVLPDGRDASGALRYREYDFETLARECSYVAAGLEAHGIVRGMRTVLMVKPSLEFFTLMFAMLQRGIVPILIDPGMGIQNLKICLAEAEPVAFIGIPKAHVARMALRWARNTLQHFVCVGRKLPLCGPSLDSLREQGQAQPQREVLKVQSDEMAAMLFTSGSTGVPKGVVYSHGNFTAQIQMLYEVFELSPNEVDLATFPPFALFDPALGMTSVIPDMDPTQPAAVNPEHIFDAIERYQCTHMFGSPALLNTVSRAGVQQGKKLPSLQRILSAGAPVPYQTLERMQKLLTGDATVLTPYGATESLPISVMDGHSILAETRSQTERGEGVCIGKPVQGIDVKIIEIRDGEIPSWDEALVLPDGEIGEIVVKGDNVTQAYFNRPESTQQAKILDAETDLADANTAQNYRHRMGDLGYFDAQGRLWFCGRKAHRVQSNKQVFYTLPCESVLNTHPDVYRTALVGVPTSDGKDIEPVICVELEQNASRHRDQVKLDLLEIAARYPHTRPIRRFLFHPSLPVDIRHNSKIFREKLAVWAAQELKR